MPDELVTSDKARILAVGPTPPPINGMSMATGFLLRTRAARDLGIELIDTADRRGLGNVGRFDLHNVRLALLHGARFLAALIRLRPCVVYVPIAQNMLGFLRDALFLVPARFAGASIVIHIHGGHFGEFYERSSGWLRALIRATVGRASAVIVLGDCLRDMVTGVVDPSRVHVVPNGMDPIFSDEAPGPTDRTVLWLSKMDAAKGFADVIEAIPSVLQQVPSARFVFAGEWLSDSEREAANQRVGSLGITDHVRFVGPVYGADKEQLLKQASVFVLPTRYRYEGQPYAILEAMSHGVPVVTSPAGCIVETVLDGQTGLLVPAGDVIRLASAVIELLSDEAMRTKLGAAGRKRFEERFTSERWDERMSSILETAVRERIME